MTESKKGMVARVAAAARKLNKKDVARAEAMLPPAVQQRLRRAFTIKGLTFFTFYVLLRKVELGVIRPEDEDFPDLPMLFRQAVLRLAQVHSPVDGLNVSPQVINMIAELSSEIRQDLRRVQRDPTVDAVWKRLNHTLVPLLAEVAKDKRVYLQPRFYGTKRWATLKAMTPRQEKIALLQDDEPETYALVLKHQQTVEEIDDRIKRIIVRQGLKYERTMKGKRYLVHVGEDPDTGERVIFDRDGDVYPEADFWARTDQKEETRKHLVRVPDKTEVPIDALRRLQDSYLPKLKGAVKYVALTDDRAKASRLTRIFPVKNHSVMEYDHVSGELMQCSYRVISAGRYRGIYLDDMVNGQGRLIEGTGYTYDEKTGVSGKIPVKIDPASREPYVTTAEMKIRRGDRTITQQKLYVKITGAENRELINALKSIATNTPPATGSIDSVIYASGEVFEQRVLALQGVAEKHGDTPAVEAMQKILDELRRGMRLDPGQMVNLLKPLKKRFKLYFDKYQEEINPATDKPYKKDKTLAVSTEASFYFDPKDFAAVRDRLQGMSLSKAAQETVKDYFLDLSRADAATATANLGYYEAQEIGGFKSHLRDRTGGGMKPVTLSTAQKQALAWADANGNRGVVGMDTGVGKTLFSVAMMQKLIRDGVADEGASFKAPGGGEVKTNGRFLFVCPKALQGNLPKEIHTFIRDASELTSRIDILTFQQFGTHSKNRRVPAHLDKAYWGGQTSWDPQKYVAVFFDEAQELSNTNTVKATAALELMHPRKILMTASPMGSSPMEAYNLAAIANNQVLTGSSDEAKRNRLERDRFKSRFCEVLGGRIIGLKRDPADPNLQQELMTWTKRNVFYRDKTDSEDVILPDLSRETMASTMDPEVEQAYRLVTEQFARTMEGMVSTFRDRGVIDETGAINPAARGQNLERLMSKEFRAIIQLLNGLSNYPDRTLRQLAGMIQDGVDARGKLLDRRSTLGKIVTSFSKVTTPGALVETADLVGNPKLDSATHVVAEKLAVSAGAAKTLLFSDDPELCMLTGHRLSMEVPGAIHAVALRNSIHLFSDGSEMASLHIPLPRALAQAVSPVNNNPDTLASIQQGVTVHTLPFRPLKYKMHPALKQGTLNPGRKKNEWQVFVLQDLLSRDSRVKTATLHGKTYETGQNLQAFSTVVHLDRDTWSSESMKQRTARAWRQGQQNPVDEVTIDATYGDEAHGFDKTLDQIRGFYQQIESSLFDAIIKEAQKTELGVEYSEMDKRSASFYRIDKEILELLTSPHASRSLPTDTSREP